MKTNFSKELQVIFINYRESIVRWFSDFYKAEDQVYCNSLIPECFSYFTQDLISGILNQRLNSNCVGESLTSISSKMVKAYHEDKISEEDMIDMFIKHLEDNDLKIYVDEFKYISLDNVLKRELFPNERSRWNNGWSEIHEMVQNIYTPTYQQDDVCVDDVLEEKRFSIQDIFNNIHDSDEECYLSVVKFDGEIVCTISKYGDRSDTDVKWTSKEDVIRIKTYLNKFIDSNNDWLSQMDILDEKETFFEVANNQYLNFKEYKGNIYYTMDSPKWGSSGNKTNFGTFIMNEEDKLVSCKFIKFLDDSASWKDKKSMCLVESYLKKIEISAKKIYFQITK